MESINKYKSVVVEFGVLRRSVYRGKGALSDFYLERPDRKTKTINEILDGFEDNEIVITVSKRNAIQK